MFKHVFDITVSFIGLVILSPLLLAIATLIKLDSKGPIFFRGQRVGRFGKPLGIYKFRTMVVNAEKLGGPSTAVHQLGHFTGYLVKHEKVDAYTFTEAWVDIATALALDSGKNHNTQGGCQ